MGYKLIIFSAAALLFDIALGVFMPGVPPVALVVLVFYMSLKLDYWQAIPLALFSGFLYDLSLLDGSIFNLFYLLLIAIITKVSSHRVVDFSNPSIQVIALTGFLFIRTLIFYALYDRSFNSSFLLQNLIVIAVVCMIMITVLSIVRYYAQEK